MTRPGEMLELRLLTPFCDLTTIHVYVCIYVCVCHYACVYVIMRVCILGLPSCYGERAWVCIHSHTHTHFTINDRCKVNL